jgi:hypothetical protein
MVVIQRSNKPVAVIKRRSKEHLPETIHPSWQWGPGLPPNPEKAAYHTIEINGVGHAFLWDPFGRLGPEWTVGKWSCSPGVMAPHVYRGECSIIYRSPSTPDPVEQARSQWRRR